MSSQVLEPETYEAVKPKHTVSMDNFPQEPASAVSALRELYALLEDYSPMWYTQEVHDRASAALSRLRPH